MALKIVSFIFIFALVAATLNAEDGSTLYEIAIKNIKQLKTIGELERKLNLDVWSHILTYRKGWILVGKDQRMSFENEFTAAGIEHKIVVNNMNELFELERNRLAEAANSSSGRNDNGGIAIDKMYTYEEVNKPPVCGFLEELARNHPSVDVLSQGTTIEGRPIKYIRISSTNFMEFNKPVVFIQALIQAREWISLPVVLHAINKLVTDITDQDVVDDIDWIILPIANPDGYEFSRISSRLWTKNRRINNNECIGVNINRNFDVEFYENPSTNPCSENFRGQRAESEIETRSIRDILLLNQGRIQLFLNLQSFGSQILYGFGNGILPSNSIILNFLAVQMAETKNNILTCKDHDYIVGNIANVLGPEFGSAMDYATRARDVLHSYTIKLPSYGNGINVNNELGYLVDPKFFEKAAEEAWEAIKIAARFVRDFEYPSP
ncbi:carboxypeptidase B-like [Achroia grisella]|uniref:carboxypeptidase B-like n=1 Tax=Achroia grisella TaxID=688607 RepID=UPI0027D32F80|nr:carboxypeptidase B-like [Achroia grisella]